MRVNVPIFMAIFSSPALWSSSANAQLPNLGGAGGGLEPLVETVESLTTSLGNSLGLNGVLGEGSPVNNLLDSLDSSAVAGGTSESDDSGAVVVVTGSEMQEKQSRKEDRLEELAEMETPQQQKLEGHRGEKQEEQLEPEGRRAETSEEIAEMETPQQQQLEGRRGEKQEEMVEKINTP